MISVLFANGHKTRALNREHSVPGPGRECFSSSGSAPAFLGGAAGLHKAGGHGRGMAALTWEGLAVMQLGGFILHLPSTREKGGKEGEEAAKCRPHLPTCEESVALSSDLSSSNVLSKDATAFSLDDVQSLIVL